jgi:ribonuclease J
MARELGIPAENIVVAENGQVVELSGGELKLAERVPGGYVFVEGGSIGEVDLGIMREREKLARGGIVLIDLSIDKFTNRPLHEPEVITRGFVTSEDAGDLIPAIRQRIKELVNGGGLDDEKVIVDAVRSFLYNETKRRPMVFVTMSKA